MGRRGGGGPAAKMNPAAAHLNTATPSYTRCAPPHPATMSNETKHNALAEAIAKICAEKVNPEIAKLAVELGAIRSRLDMMESITPPKRQPRTSAKPASAKGGAKSATKSTEAKVTNALLFFRYALKNDLEGFRETYADDDAIETVASSDQVVKKDRTKDEADYFSAVGAALWKGLGDEQRKEVRTRFDAWKQDQSRDNDPAPLEEEEEAGEA